MLKVALETIEVPAGYRIELVKIPPKTWREMNGWPKNKPVLQFGMNGKFIRRHESILRASKATGAHYNCIPWVCNGSQMTAAGFQWRFAADTTEDDLEPVVYKPRRCPEKPVAQYDLDGNLLATFPSIRAADRATEVCLTGIIRCCKETQKQYRGYAWKYLPTPNSSLS